MRWTAAAAVIRNFDDATLRSGQAGLSLITLFSYTISWYEIFELIQFSLPPNSEHRYFFGAGCMHVIALYAHNKINNGIAASGWAVIITDANNCHWQHTAWARMPWSDRQLQHIVSRAKIPFSVWWNLFNLVHSVQPVVNQWILFAAVSSGFECRTVVLWQRCLIERCHEFIKFLNADDQQRHCRFRCAIDSGQFDGEFRSNRNFSASNWTWMEFIVPLDSLTSTTLTHTHTHSPSNENIHYSIERRRWRQPR